MSSNKRMNLFRELIQTSRPTFTLAQLKIGAHGYACLAVVILFVVSEIPKYREHQALVGETTAKKEELQTKLQDLLKQAEAQAAVEAQARLAAAKAKKEEEEARKNRTERVVLSQESSQLDGTWTAVVWKLVTFAEQVVVQKIDLGATEGSPPPGAGSDKRVIVEGAAKNLRALTQWVESLSQNLPQSSFTIDRQALSDDKTYPVTFRLTARML